MRKTLLAAAGFLALAAGAGTAMARGGDGAGLFSRADANNDAVVTRQEFDAAHAARFAALDGDRDGQVSRAEMRAGWRDRREERGNRRWESADVNNDGNVSRDEFLARPIAMFDRMDANHDGVLSADERAQMREAHRGRHGEGGGPGHGMHGGADANDDGQISRAEFDAHGASMFERLDANHDGRVTRDEAEAARGHFFGRGR